MEKDSVIYKQCSWLLSFSSVNIQEAKNIMCCLQISCGSWTLIFRFYIFKRQPFWRFHISVLRPFFYCFLSLSWSQLVAIVSSKWLKKEFFWMYIKYKADVKKITKFFSDTSKTFSFKMYNYLLKLKTMYKL